MPQVNRQRIGRPALSPGGSVVGRISDVGFDREDGLKVLVYGRSGTGKTTWWATAPKPILAILCSGGSKPGELRSIDTPEYRKSIRQVVLNESTELRDLVDWLGQEGRGDFKTVVLDHSTGFQDLVLKEILGVDELPAQKTFGMATQQQYGQCTLQCKEALRSLLSLNQNVVVVAQEREFNNDADSALITPSVGAGLTPSLAGWLNQAVDYIVQTYLKPREEVVENTIGGKVIKTTMRVDGVEYCLRTGPDSVYTTKFRIPRGRPLPPYLVDPTFDKVMSLVRGEG